MKEFLKNSQKLKKIVICGYGNMGKKYEQILKLNWPNIELSIWRSGLKNKNIKTTSNIQFNTFENVISWKPDAAIISSPASVHLHQATLLSQFDIPLLIEKPLGMPEDSSEKFSELELKSRQLPILVGYILRHEPCLINVKKILEEKKIGKILELDLYCGSWLPEWRENLDYRDSVSSNKSLGGGALLELSHEIDLANYLFGEFKILGANISNSNLLEVNVEDQVCILGVSKYNIQITIRLNFCSKPYKRILNIRGSEGEINWDISSGDLLVINKNNFQIKNNFSINSSTRLKKQISHFFECVNFKKEPICTVKDGIEVLKIIKRVKEFIQFTKSF